MEILTNFSDPKAVVPDNDEILVIDHSISSTYRCCEEKGNLAYIQHLKSKKAALPLVFGSAMHAAIEAFHNLISLGDFKIALKGGLIAIDKSLEEDKTQLPRTIKNSDDEKRSLERCRMLFSAYTQKWANELFITKYVEKGFAIDLSIQYKGRPILYVGKIDRVVEKIINKSLHNIETKTTAQGLSYFMERKKPNHQITGYQIALMELLGIKPQSTIWDAIFISTRQPDLKKGGWFEYGIDIDKDFDRQETGRSETDIQEWYYDIRRTALRFFEFRDSDLHRGERNDQMCHNYGGCGFRLICESNRNPAIISSEYTVKKWEPWKGIMEKQIEN